MLNSFFWTSSIFIYSYISECFYTKLAEWSFFIVISTIWQYSAFVVSFSLQVPVSCRGCEACIYLKRNFWDHETTLEIFASAYRRRRFTPLWKLGRNWPEFNPGIQFSVVFVPRVVNPIDAHIRQTFSRSNLRLLGVYFPLCSRRARWTVKGAGGRLNSPASLVSRHKIAYSLCIW